MDWHKSSYSSESPNCVEVAVTDESVLVRNSKKPNDATVEFTHDEWDAFLKGVANGEFRV